MRREGKTRRAEEERKVRVLISTSRRSDLERRAMGTHVRVVSSEQEKVGVMIQVHQKHVGGV